MCKCDHWYQYEYLYSVHVRVCLPGMLTCTGASKVTARVHESKQTSASVYICLGHTVYAISPLYSS